MKKYRLIKYIRTTQGELGSFSWMSMSANTDNEAIKEFDEMDIDGAFFEVISEDTHEVIAYKYGNPKEQPSLFPRQPKSRAYDR